MHSLPPSSARPASIRLAAFLSASLLISTMGCTEQPRDERPSLLLIVIDTLRADAVSAFGQVSGTTPRLDALAAEGLLYKNALTPAPWTLPSHASLFTGLRPDQHGVAVRGSWVAPDALVTLAERLRDAGYQTFGFSENPFVSKAFGLDQGFERFASLTGNEKLTAEQMREGVGRWLRDRDRSRPLFLFLNFMDPHEPYRVRAENPFAPAGVTPDALRSLDQSSHRICEDLPPPAELDMLRGLYLGEVAAADAKLAAVLDAMSAAGLTRRLITVVASDHGQHLGEHRLLGHQWSVRTPLLHVPLVVHGLPDVAPAVIGQPVDLIDVVPSVLGWLGQAPASDLPGRPLPVVDAPPTGERAFVSFYTEFPAFDWPASIGAPPLEPLRREARCGAGDPVRGRMLALTQFPYRLLWFDRYPAELYDVRWDAAERSNLAKTQPELAARLSEEAQHFVESHDLPDPRSVDPQKLQPEILNALRALGYVD